MRLTRRSSSSISAAATPLLMICSAMMTLASVGRPGVPLEVNGVDGLECSGDSDSERLSLDNIEWITGMRSLAWVQLWVIDEKGAAMRCKSEHNSLFLMVVKLWRRSSCHRDAAVHCP